MYGFEVWKHQEIKNVYLNIIWKIKLRFQLFLPLD